jgi:hypothetical protein
MTTSAGSATPGQWKEVTVRHLRKVWDALQRATTLGPSRSVARNISMEWQFCEALFGERNRKSRDAGSAGRKRRPFSRAAPGRPGLLRGDFPHASVKKGSRQSPTAARSPVAADPTAGEPAGRCLRDVARRPERCPIRLRKQGDRGPTAAARRRSSDSVQALQFPEREPGRTDEPQIRPEGVLRKQRSSPGGWWSGPSSNAGKRPGSDTQRSRPHESVGVLLGGRASGLR